MSRLLRFLILACLLTWTDTAAATSVVWTLSGVTFDDGGTASGTFTFDADIGLFFPWSITVTGAGLFPAESPFTYADTSLNAFSSGVIFCPTFVPGAFICGFLPSATDGIGFSRGLDLLFTSPLTDSGGTVGIQPGSPFMPPNTAATLSFEAISGIGLKIITAGSVTASPAPTPVPEPASLLLLGSGLAGLALRRRNFIKVSQLAIRPRKPLPRNSSSTPSRASYSVLKPSAATFT